MDCHTKLNHEGTEHVRNELRLLYWIPHSSSIVRKVLNDCSLCKRRRIKPQPPLMASFPKDRLQVAASFSKVGVDYFGPIMVKHLLLPCGVFSDNEISSKKRWKQAQVVVDQVWSRWLKEYLPALIERKKWNLPSHNLSVGDLVLVADEKTQRGDWPLAHVTRIFPWKDDTIQVCSTKYSLYKKPVAKLALLEECPL
ncbi:uncharacterized protein [Montipora foliosa]|uniref:uncharacterized protein n=1 Tax=Montipora foliosa TaxID=591990 RepID=UPI0035F193DE